MNQKLCYAKYMIKINVLIILLISSSLVNYAKADLFGDILEEAGKAIIQEALEVDCEEPAEGVCKCSPYTVGTGNVDIVNAWDNCKGKITYEDNQSLVANFKNGNAYGKCSAFDANGKEYPGDCSSGSWVELKKENKSNSASNSGSNAESPNSAYTSSMQLFYQYDLAFKPCATSGGISQAQYKSFLKQSKQYSKFAQKKHKIKDKDLKELKKIAYQNAKKEMEATTSLFPMIGVGLPMSQLTGQQYAGVVQFCSDIWGQSTMILGIAAKEMNQGSNSQDDLPF